MTQDGLTKIFDQDQEGPRVVGWSSMDYVDHDLVRRHAPDTMWVRKFPDGKWTECL